MSRVGMVAAEDQPVQALVLPGRLGELANNHPRLPQAATLARQGQMADAA